jgi:hypothetical protein
MAGLKSGRMVLGIVNVNYKPQYDFKQDLIIQDSSVYNNGNPGPSFYPAMATKNGDVNDPYVHVAFNISKANKPTIELALSAAQEVIQKLWKIEDSPYMVGFEINWSVYYYRPPYINPGGYVENPITEANPSLPDYFYSPLAPQDSNFSKRTLFDYLYAYNPQCYLDKYGYASISCLRKSDSIEYQRTWFKVTRSWLCSAVGMWDLDINSNLPRPIYAGKPKNPGDPEYYDITY